MTSQPIPESNGLLSDPRPWAFTRAELTAALRRHTGDPSLVIENLKGNDITQRRPAIGRFRGLLVTAEGKVTGKHTFTLVLKEPQGATRKGTAGVGRREVSLYQILADHLPVRVPQLFAAHPGGDWLVMELLPIGRLPEQWTADDYLLATDQLVALHDRFWNLGEDLNVYNWLARPLDSDFQIHVKAAAYGMERLVENALSTLLTDDPDLAQIFSRLISQADKISESLLAQPATLLHGDYWPGNVHVHKDGTLTVYDWQHAGIGPGVLDLLSFVQASRWWFDPLPIDPADIIQHYRKSLQEASGHKWSQKDWEAQWDNALLWTFVARWVDLLAAIPEPILQSRHELLESVWLKPVREAAARCLVEV